MFKNRKNNIHRIILILLLISPFCFFYYLSKGKHYFQDLPNYGKTDVLENLSFRMVENDSSIVLTSLNSKIKVLEWATTKETKLRDIHNKLTSKKNIFYFISYFPFDDQMEAGELKNYLERAKISKKNWYFIYDAQINFNTALETFQHFFLKKNGVFKPAENQYILIDPENQIRGIYTEKELKKIEEDMRLIYRNYKK
jgi:hypothetical protein